MNKWQKIVGVIAFGAIGICELLMRVVTYADIRAWKVTFAAHDCKDVLYAVMGGYAFLFWISYALAFCFFICLWRKGGKR